MDDLKASKAFISSVRDKAQNIVHQDHISAEVRDVMKDMIEISIKLQDVISQSFGAGADTRVLRKKLDNMNAELKAMQTKMDTARKLVLSLAEEIKVISMEAGAILKRHSDGTSPEAGSANRIRAAAQKMVECIVQLSQP